MLGVGRPNVGRLCSKCGMDLRGLWSGHGGRVLRRRCCLATPLLKAKEKIISCDSGTRQGEGSGKTLLNSAPGGS